MFQGVPLFLDQMISKETHEMNPTLWRFRFQRDLRCLSGSHAEWLHLQRFAPCLHLGEFLLKQQLCNLHRHHLHWVGEHHIHHCNFPKFLRNHEPQTKERVAGCPTTRDEGNEILETCKCAYRQYRCYKTLGTLVNYFFNASNLRGQARQTKKKYLVSILINERTFLP